MRAEYERLIEEHDKTLSVLREMWMLARTSEKDERMKLLNRALEERFRLMGLRDAPIQIEVK